MPLRGAIRIAVALLALTAPVAAPAGAQQSAQSDGQGGGTVDVVPQPVIGVIDLQRILRDATAAQGVRAEREKFVTAYQADAAQVEQELRAADQELARLRAGATTEEFAHKRREFQERVATSQREVQSRRRNLERAFGAAMTEVQQATIQVADHIAAEAGVNVILYRSQVFLFDNGMDLTDEILDELNRRLPQVAFPDPASLPEAGDGDAAPPLTMPGD